ncbi:G-protein coupled receptor 39 [Pangasianodon hypophthalmus]|uniref:G-protein coupled receptor 39 n=1 Tax=Pangasianodon hypophthalmus TaxID=310915 RepID=UPI000F003BF5|nr:G-protein coupled receptor 39 [Pangasianodon hypophthalmus]
MAEQESERDWRKLETQFHLKVFLTVLYSIILILGIVGNSITIHVTQVLQRNGYLQKNVTDHMVSLACSDLLVLLIGMPVELYSAIWFPFSSASGNTACKIYNFLFEACSYATILNVTTLSFERYMAICHPFRHKTLARARTAHLILAAWLTSVLVAVPLLITTGTQGHVVEPGGAPAQNLTFCTNLHEYWGMYRSSVFAAFILYLLVLGSVAFMCRSMIVVLRAPMITMDTSGTSVPKHESARVKQSRKQTIIFLVLIVCALFVCWMPNQVRRIMTAAIPKDKWSMSYLISYVKLHPVADTFFYLSSVLNPLLYNLSSRQFRTAFLQTLCCRLSIQHVNKKTVEKSKASHASSHSLHLLLRKKSQHRSMQPSSRDAETLTPSAESSAGVQILNTPPPVSSETET